MGVRSGLGIILSLIMLAGCATTKVWRSDPGVQSLETQYFAARLEPIKAADTRFFDAFRLSVRNKTDDPLEVNWAQSRYIYDERSAGGFVFKGLDAERINDPPSETIPAQGSLSKIIWPVQLMGWTPIRDKRVPGGQRGFSRGLLPDGENGIELVIERAGEEVRERLSLKISSR